MKYKNSTNNVKEYFVNLDTLYLEDNKIYSYSDVSFTKNNYLRLCDKKPFKREITKNEFYHIVEFSEYSIYDKYSLFEINSISEYINIIMFYRFIYLLEKAIQLSHSLNDEKVMLSLIESLSYFTEYEYFYEIKKNILNGRMNWEYEIRSIKFEISKLDSQHITKYNDILDDYLSNSVDIYFRGVGQPIYPEQAGIFRVSNGKYETKMFKDIVIRYPNVFNKFNTIESLTHMQHFELKTRLLDITTNPLVALYMAVNKIYTNDVLQNDYGEVIVYFAEQDSVKYYDSFKVLINAKLVFLSQEEKDSLFNLIEKAINVDKINVVEKVLWNNECFSEKIIRELNNHIEKCDDIRRAVSAYYKLLSVIRMDYPAFLNKISLEGLIKAYIVNVGYINERISAQSGGFIIFGLDKEYLTQTRKEPTGIYSNRILKYLPRIIIKNKKKVFLELNAMGINDSTMLPDIEHATKFINKKYDL